MHEIAQRCLYWWRYAPPSGARYRRLLAFDRCCHEFGSNVLSAPCLTVTSTETCPRAPPAYISSSPLSFTHTPQSYRSIPVHSLRTNPASPFAALTYSQPTGDRCTCTVDSDPAARARLFRSHSTTVNAKSLDAEQVVAALSQALTWKMRTRDVRYIPAIRHINRSTSPPRRQHGIPANPIGFPRVGGPGHVYDTRCMVYGVRTPRIRHVLCFSE